MVIARWSKINWLHQLWRIMVCFTNSSSQKGLGWGSWYPWGFPQFLNIPLLVQKHMIPHMKATILSWLWHLYWGVTFPLKSTLFSKSGCGTPIIMPCPFLSRSQKLSTRVIIWCIICHWNIVKYIFITMISLYQQF